jgi:hypothetical protein
MLAVVVVALVLQKLLDQVVLEVEAMVVLLPLVFQALLTQAVVEVEVDIFQQEVLVVQASSSFHTLVAKDLLAVL